MKRKRRRKRKKKIEKKRDTHAFTKHQNTTKVFLATENTLARC